MLCHLEIMWWCPITEKKVYFFCPPFFNTKLLWSFGETFLLAFVEPHTWDKKLVQLTKGIGLILLEVWCFYSSGHGDIPSAAVAPPLLILALGLTDKGFLVEMYCDIFVFLRV